MNLKGIIDSSFSWGLSDQPQASAGSQSGVSGFRGFQRLSAPEKAIIEEAVKSGQWEADSCSSNIAALLASLSGGIAGKLKVVLMTHEGNGFSYYRGRASYAFHGLFPCLSG